MTPSRPAKSRVQAPSIPPPATVEAEPVPGESEQEDLRLVEAVRSDDRAAWGTLIEKHQDRLFAMCVRMVRDRELAQDLTHDAFIKIIQGIDSFDGRARLTTWMTRIAMNVCLSKLRSEKLRRHPSLDAMRDPESRGGKGGRKGGTGGKGGGEGGRGLEFEQSREPDGEERVEAAEERNRLLDALRNLDPEQRQVLILADQQQLGYDQIAEVLGVAVGTVKSRVFRARAALREAIESAASAEMSERSNQHRAGRGPDGMEKRANE